MFRDSNRPVSQSHVLGLIHRKRLGCGPFKSATTEFDCLIDFQIRHDRSRTISLHRAKAPKSSGSSNSWLNRPGIKLIEVCFEGVKTKQVASEETILLYHVLAVLIALIVYYSIALATILT